MNDSKLPAPAATDELLQCLRVVLVRTSHPGNIGAAARAMKTMGLSRLVLVRPRIFPDAAATAMASGADDVLAAAQVCDSLATALGGVTMALALTARPRVLAAQPLWAREAAAQLLQAGRDGGQMALVFGNETSGLSNEELSLCQRWAMIPANPVYSSLNLAAAVQLLCYEVRMALLTPPPPPRPADAGAPATSDDVAALLARIEAAALRSGFVDAQRPARFMQRLRRLAARAALERQEVNLLQGLLTAIERDGGADGDGEV